MTYKEQLNAALMIKKAARGDQIIKLLKSMAIKAKHGLPNASDDGQYFLRSLAANRGGPYNSSVDDIISFFSKPGQHGNNVIRKVPTTEGSYKVDGIGSPRVDMAQQLKRLKSLG